MILDEAGWRWCGARVAGATVAFAVAAAIGCASPLPEPESQAAHVYVRECGTCHPAYPPHLLKAAMWRIQVERMEDIRKRRGLPPLTVVDEQTILDYLTRHAG